MAERSNRRAVAGLMVSGLVLGGVLTGCGSPTPPVALLPPKASVPPSPAGPKLLGEEKKSAADVFADARAAFLGASSVHVTGTITEDDDLVSVDGQLGPDSGRFEERTSEGVVELRTTGGISYVKAPSGYFADDEEFPDQLAGKWVAVPATDDDLKVVLSNFLDGLQLPSTSTLNPTVEQDTMGGRQVVVLTYRNGEKLYVSNEGKPELMAHVYSNESQTFDRYGEPLSVDAPKDAVQLDPEGGGGSAGAGGKTA